MKKVLIFILSIVTFSGSFAQNRVNGFIDKLSHSHSVSGARVTVKMDSDSRDAVNNAPSVSTVSGYRICIFFGNSQTGRSEGRAVLEQFGAKFPGVDADFTYVEPNYKIHVGAYLDKGEANKMLTAIKGSFPKAFIVSTPLPIQQFVSYKNSAGSVDQKVDE